MPLTFIFDVDDPTQSGLVADFLSQGTQLTVPEFVRGDKSLAINLRPVKKSASGVRPFDDDHLTGDIYRLGIGLPDEPASGGTFTLKAGGGGTLTGAIAYNATGTALAALLNVALTADGKPNVSATLLADGLSYQIDGLTNGAIPTLVADASNLSPVCVIVVSSLVAGSVSAKAQQIVSIKQQPVAYSEPSTELTAAGVTVTQEQDPTASQNSIYRIHFAATGTYGGTYRPTLKALGVTASVGAISPLLSEAELGLALANHPSLSFSNSSGAANNVIVSKSGADYLIEFTGTLAGSTLRKSISAATVANPSELTTSTDHGYATGDSVTITSSAGTTPSLNGTYTITVTASNKFTIPLNVTVSSGVSATVYNNSELIVSAVNVDLLAPKGVSGTIDLNTVNLFKKFQTEDGDTLTFYLSVERERVSGEIKTPLLIPVILRRDIIDVTSLVAMALVNFTSLDFSSVPSTDPHIAGRIYRSGDFIAISNG